MIDENRIFHLEVLTGLRPPETVQQAAEPDDAYRAATIYFNSFMIAMGAPKRCGVCNRFHEEYGYE